MLNFTEIPPWAKQSILHMPRRSRINIQIELIKFTKGIFNSNCLLEGRYFMLHSSHHKVITNYIKHTSKADLQHLVYFIEEHK